jgi:hypothetical protein
MRALALPLSAAVGAMVGALLAAAFKVGANTSCMDVIDGERVEVSGLCVAPSAAWWAIATGAAVGALLAVAAAATMRRRRL